jgi:hypothetical protein
MVSRDELKKLIDSKTRVRVFVNYDKKPIYGYFRSFIGSMITIEYFLQCGTCTCIFMDGITKIEYSNKKKGGVIWSSF